MAFVTPQMGLTAWDLASDPYDHNELYNNWVLIDAHDHGANGGAPLTLDSIPPITNAKLADNAVTTFKIQNGSVTQDKLATDSVGSQQLQNDSVTSAKIVNGSIQTEDLADGAITEGKLAPGVVTSTIIDNSSVTVIKLADRCVSNKKLGHKCVRRENLDDDSCDENHYRNSSISESKLKDRCVSKGKIKKRSIGHHEHDRVPCCSLTRNTSMSITKTTSAGNHIWTAITWNVSRWSYEITINNDGITINVPGIYIIEAGCAWDEEPPTGTEGVRRVRLMKNGRLLCGDGPLQTYRDDIVGPFRPRHSLHIAEHCLIGDKIKLEAFTSSSTNSQIKPDGFGTHLSCTWVSPAADDIDD